MGLEEGCVLVVLSFLECVRVCLCLLKGDIVHDFFFYFHFLTSQEFTYPWAEPGRDGFYCIFSHNTLPRSILHKLLCDGWHRLVCLMQRSSQCKQVFRAEHGVLGSYHRIHAHIYISLLRLPFLKIIHYPIDVL